MIYVKTYVGARRNARGRSAQEHLVAALRRLYRRAVGDGLIKRRTTRRRRSPSRGACRPSEGRCQMPGWRRSARSLRRSAPPPWPPCSNLPVRVAPNRAKRWQQQPSSRRTP